MKISPFLIKILMLLSLSILAACAKPNNDEARNPASTNEYVLNALSTSVHVYFDHRPLNTSDAGSMTLEFFDPKDKSVMMDPAEIKVKLWMPELGHGSSPTTVTRVQRGVYRVDNMYFTRAGLWEIRIGVQDENGLVDNVTVKERF